MSDEENSYYSKKPKSRHRGKGGNSVKPTRERKSHHASTRQRRGKSSFDDEESSAEDSVSDSDEEFKSMRRKGHLRKNTGRKNVTGRNGEVRTSTRSIRKVSYVESEGSDEADEGKKKKSQKVPYTFVIMFLAYRFDFLVGIMRHYS